MNRKIIKILVNVITLTRLIGAILLVPIFINYGPLISGYFLLILFLTDFLDGKLARIFKVQTYLGAILDQVCDKILSLTSLISLSIFNPIFIIPLIFESAITLVNIKNESNNGDSDTTFIGKVKMWFLGLAIVVGFFCTEVILNNDFNILSNSLANIISTTVAIVASNFSAIALYSYIIKSDKIDKKYSDSVKSFKEIWFNITSTTYLNNNPKLTKKELIYKKSE